MERGSSCDDQFSEVQVVACNLCSLDPPVNPVATACGHCFCWPCIYKFLQGQAKPCPKCSTMLGSHVNAAPAFDDTHGTLVLWLPTAEQVEASLDEDMLDCSDAAAFAPVSAPSEEERSARRDVDMVVV